MSGGGGCAQRGYAYNVPPRKRLAAPAALHINRTLTGQETMLDALKRRWKQGKIKTVYLVALAVFFLGAFIWHPSFGQNQPTAGEKAAAAVDKAKLPPNPTDKMGQNTPGIEKQEEFH